MRSRRVHTGGWNFQCGMLAHTVLRWSYGDVWCLFSQSQSLFNLGNASCFLRLCRLKHQPLCSSPRQPDQHVIQLSGDVSNKSSFKTQCCERQVIDACWFVPVSFHVFVNFCQSRPTAKNSRPFPPLAVLTFKRLRLILRRERADPLLLLRWSCAFLLYLSLQLVAIAPTPVV